MIDKKKEVCKECNGKGTIFVKGKGIRICFKCLIKGKLT